MTGCHFFGASAYDKVLYTLFMEEKICTIEQFYFLQCMTDLSPLITENA